jgi:DNA polymerase III delta prime subunit
MAPAGAPPFVMSVSELVGPLGFPLGSTLVGGLAPTGCRPLRPSQALPEIGTVIGDSDLAGQQRPIAVELQGRYRHVLLTGPTGTGKTTLMINMVVQDLEEDRAVLVLDPKSDLVDGILERMPSKRRGDVVILSPADGERPVGFNPLRAGGDPELAVEQTVSIMHKLWASSWGVRSEALLRTAMRTLILDTEASLTDIGPLLTSPAFRAPLVARLTDPVLVGQWAAFEALSAAEQGQWVSPPMNKLNGLLSRPGLRRVLAQPNPTFDLAHALDNRGVVLVPLSAGVLGTDAASLFGSFVMGAAWNYIQARAAKALRPPLMVHLDEVSRLAFAAPLDEILSQARSFNVGVTLATQHLNQLSPDLRHAVLANPRSRVAFQPSHDDAQVLARQFGLGLTADDLQGLDPHQVVAQLFAAGRTQPACTLKTRPAAEPSSDRAALRAESAKRWGSDGAAVDAWLMKRMTGESHTPGPRTVPGRKPRSDR